VAVAGGLTFRQVAVGNESVCGLTTAGAAYCWGTGRSGGLGNGGTSDSPSPVAVSGGHTFVQVAAGTWFACGRTAQGQAWCWGYAYAGRLGNGGAFTHTDWAGDYNPVPVQVKGGLSFTDITTGAAHACGIAEGRAYCWGANGSGQLGNGTLSSYLEPSPVAGGLSFKDIAAGGSTTCGVTEQGSAYCWGRNADGALGTDPGSLAASAVPTLVRGNGVFASIDTGGGRTCAVTVEGAAHCWGAYPVPNKSPRESYARFEYHYWTVPGALFGAVTAGAYSSCGMDTAGRLRCWLSHLDGLMGNGAYIVTTETIPPEPMYVHVPRP
jgi:hypothetical protein